MGIWKHYLIFQSCSIKKQSRRTGHRGALIHIRVLIYARQKGASLGNDMALSRPVLRGRRGEWETKISIAEAGKREYDGERRQWGITLRKGKNNNGIKGGENGLVRLHDIA